MRRALYPAIDPLLRSLTNDRLYSQYDLTEAEYVRTVHESPAVVEKRLKMRGYEDSGWTAAVKGLENYDMLERASLRHTAGRWQYHVHLFGARSTRVYSHYEMRPDLRPLPGESLSEMKARLQEHLHPSWGRELEEGVTYVLGKHYEVDDL